MIEIGLKHTSELRVTDDVTAITVGSGDMPVLATPMMKATAEVTKVDGKKIEFKVSAYSGETLLGEGTHLRFVVDRERFMSKLG